MTQYDRFYCYRCSAYPPQGVFMEAKAPEGSNVGQATAAANSGGIIVLEPAKQDLVPWQSTAESSGGVSPAPEENQPGDAGSSKQKRPLDREEITTAKKPLLALLCEEHGLDSTGTREELRQRLLSYLDQLEGTSASESTTEAEAVQEEASVGEAEPVEPVPTEDTSTAGAMSQRDETQIYETQPEQESSTNNTSAAPAAVETDSEMTTPEEVEPVIVPTPSREPSKTDRHAEAGEGQVAVPSTPASRVEHPCPTCGRALTYIAQYARWYCYSCQAYAPRTKAKFACPNCGASLRWIREYSRWWCDACRHYAPADLPKPGGAVAQAAPAEAVVARAAVATATTHRHQSPGSGIGLLTFGLLLFVMYEVLVDLPYVLSVDTGLVVAPDIAFGLRFFAFLFVAVGAILGLSAIRDRR